MDLGSESPGCKNVAMVLTHQPIGPASLVGLLIPEPVENRTLGPASSEEPQASSSKLQAASDKRQAVDNKE